MSGESEPVGEPDKLDAAVRGVRLVWLGLLLGAVVMLGVASAVVVSQGPFIDGEPAMFIVAMGLLTVPLGLAGAFVVAPRLPLADPDQSQGAAEPVPGFGAYTAQFFVRAGILEGPTIACTVLLIATGNWILLAAAAVLLTGLAAIVPTRERAEAVAEAARRQTDHL